MDKTSFIIVNFNGLQDTLSLLESISRHVHSPHETIVVDNGSETDETPSIKSAYPSTITIRSDKNLGFAGGNNLALPVVTGNYLFFINNDTIIDSDITVSLIDTLKSDAALGAVSPKILYYFGEQVVQFNGYTPLHPILLRNKVIGQYCPDTKELAQLSPTAFLHGAAMMVKKDVIDKVGPMSEIFFLYYEELDWSQRIKEAGYKLGVCSAQHIFHKESQSVGTRSPLKAFYMARNRLLYGWRHTSGFIRLMMILFHLLVVLPKELAVAACHKEWNLLKPIIKGNSAFFKIHDKNA